MKKTLFILMMVLAGQATFSQITITSADMPAAGRINYVYVDTTSTPGIGSPSASPQNWNFSTLYSHFPQVASFSPVTPYQAWGADFPDANSFTYGPAILYAGLFGGAPVPMGFWGYMYWKTDTAGFHVVGFRTNYGLGDRNVLEEPQELLMGTPASYDSSFSNTARWVASFNNVPLDVDTHYVSTVWKTLECDAFGTMTTPFGVFDVIRVHETLIKVDSVIGTLGSLPFYGIEALRDTFNNYHFWANGLGYPVAIVKADEDNNIFRIEYLADTVPGYTITGQVFKEDEVTPVEDGEAELIAKTLFDELYGVPETVPLVAGGHFQFSNTVPNGNFLIHARPDEISYQYDVPTYYGDSIYWQDALTLTIVSDTSIVINCRSDSIQNQLAGSGVISGNIYQDLGGAKDMQLTGGVKVTLEQNPSGITARHTYTDAQGKYAFTDVPPMNFIIRVDIAACPMDSTYFINYTAGDTTTTNLDFYYDSSFIYIYAATGIADQEEIPEAGVVVYPNPFSDYTYLYFTDVEPGKTCEIMLSDITGRIIGRYQGETPYPVRIDRPSNASGLLFYSVIIDGIRRATGKLIVK